MVSSTGKHYLILSGLSDVINMPLKKKDELIYVNQQQSCIERSDTVVNTEEINNEESYPNAVANINENRIDSQKLLTPIPKVQLIIMHSKSLDTSMSDKDVQNDQQLLITENRNVVANNLEELCPETTTKADHNEDNSRLPCASILRRQRKTKFGTLQSGLVDISINNEKEVNDPVHTKELNRAREYIKKLKKKLNSSQHKYKRLQEKATSLAFLIKQLRGEEVLPESSAELLEK